MKLKVIKDQESGKSMTVTAHQSGMSHSTTIATILKNNNKVTESVKGIETNKNSRRACIRYGGTSNDMD
jgi:DUF917 family protein